jgi:serine/threonine-protein kinase
MIDLGRWPEADALLDRALDLPAPERAAFVDREAAHDPELAAALHAILGEAARDDGFLERRTPGMAALLSEALRDAEAAATHALQPGQHFTTYEVLDLVGRGGMGEVYRACDERLGRLVALKVLPQEFVTDRQRLARFDREARLLASLNHPNIGAIYGLAEDAGRQALVLEYVEGTTIADRVKSGPIAIREVLSIAQQVALALETAHRRGIVHRDLKPANISVMADGTVKVLDFGLAKAVERDAPTPAGDITSVHTPGRILGTPAYMSPEQACGFDIDRRTDIWSFGCVLFEMLTGRRAFDGDTSHDVIAGVIKHEPDFSLLPAGTPEPVLRLLRRALAKDPRRRLADLGDALLDIEEAQHGDRQASIRPRLGASAARTAAAVAVAAVAIGGGYLLLRSWRTNPPAAVVRLGVPVPPSDELIASGQQVAALSPDGRTVVYRASRGGVVRLFRRALDGMQSEPVPGTENAAGPFFSPDGAWLGFDGDGVLQKISLAGGSPVTICQAPGGANASWGGDTIVFSTGTGRVLNRVPAGGGTPEPLTALDTAAGDLAHTFPHVMPEGNAALFTIVRASDRYVAAVRFEGRPSTGSGPHAVRIITVGSQPRYLPSGHLLFARNDTLWAAPFDEARLAMTGEPVPIVERMDTSGGAAHFAASADGSLMYAPRRDEVRDRRLVWLDRHGIETALPFESKGYTRAALSPDGQRVALALSEQDNTDIWIGHLQHGTLVRITRDPTTETAPLWMPDGKTIVYRSDRDGGGLFVQAIDGGKAERLTSSGDRLHTPHGMSPDGRTLLFTEFRSYAEQSIQAVTVGAREAPRPILTGAFAQLRPQVSPDGRWLAYQSDESGRFEVYVRPYPDVHAGRWQLSAAGGTSPRWSHDGRELFYYDGHALVVATLAISDRVAARAHRRLFAYSPFSGRLGPDFDVTPDGPRVLMIRSNDDTPATRLQLVLVQNWITEMREKLAGSK